MSLTFRLSFYKFAISQILSEWDMGLQRFATLQSPYGCNFKGPQFSDWLLDGISKQNFEGSRFLKAFQNEILKVYDFLLK
ncbi:hypothetical protein RCL_jg9131.t1 [Rhizophagus clarus]|uniref:Uncharacterized protein n=1 Tax=Rhizophagus clarus TaxID=94130 RepID=A0A8H3QDD2_9GLOM|nr:hypothetical protein RCL_jg9131.t1 [Rhizophagus clarus]